MTGGFGEKFCIFLASLQDISMDHTGGQELGGPKFLDLMVT